MNMIKEEVPVPRSKEGGVKEVPVGKKENTDVLLKNPEQMGVESKINGGSESMNRYIHQGITMRDPPRRVMTMDIRPKDIMTKSEEILQPETKVTNPPIVTPTSVTSTITISGEVFLDQLPPQIELSGQMYSKVNTGLGFQTYRSVMVVNQLCGICGDKDEDPDDVNGGDDLLIHNPCKHWSHVGCLRDKGNNSNNNSNNTNNGIRREIPQRKPCPICNPKNRPIDHGQNENYTTKLELRNGKIGYTTPINSSYKQTKMGELLEKIGPDRKLNFGGDVEVFMSNPYVSVDDYFSAGKNVIDMKRLTGITTVFELEKKGLGFVHVCNKKFSVNTDTMISLGIDRSYFREKLKSKLWPLPQIKLKGKNVLMTVHPLEYMDRKGFSKEDFIKLGWTSKKTFIEDGANMELADYVFKGR